MDRKENVVLTNMCMIYDGSKVLVEEKIGKDIWTGTWSEVRVYEFGFINNIAMPQIISAVCGLFLFAILEIL